MELKPSISLKPLPKKRNSSLFAFTAYQDHAVIIRQWGDEFISEIYGPRIGCYIMQLHPQQTVKEALAVAIKAFNTSNTAPVDASVLEEVFESLAYVQ